MDTKETALKRLVADAVYEAENPKPILPFEGSWDVPAMDRLVLTLRTSDALQTLYRMICM